MTTVPVVSPISTSSGRFTVSGSQRTTARTPARPAFAANLPRVLWFQGPIGRGWIITRPVLLTVERDDDGEFIITDNFSTVYGNGRTEGKAKVDYFQSLVDYYELVAESAETDMPSALLRYRLDKYLLRPTSGKPANGSQAPRNRRSS
jgi:hypothetical protein